MPLLCIVQKCTLSKYCENLSQIVIHQVKLWWYISLQLFDIYFKVILNKKQHTSSFILGVINVYCIFSKYIYHLLLNILICFDIYHLQGWKTRFSRWHYFDNYSLFLKSTCQNWWFSMLEKVIENTALLNYNFKNDIWKFIIGLLIYYKQQLKYFMRFAQILLSFADLSKLRYIKL